MKIAHCFPFPFLLNIARTAIYISEVWQQHLKAWFFAREGLADGGQSACGLGGRSGKGRHLYPLFLLLLLGILLPPFPNQCLMIAFIPWIVSSAAGTRPIGQDLCLNFGFITKVETVVLATDLFWTEQKHVRPMCGPYSREIQR